MSGKNRAFALAVATAALVGVSAPVAHAASGPGGFNHDSLVNVSGNQVPIQVCNNSIPVKAGLGVVQVPIGGVAGALGVLNTGTLTSSADRNCTQTPTQTHTSTTKTKPTAPKGHAKSGPSGFNHDSLVNVSGNQVPIQVCNNSIPVKAGLGVVQVPIVGVARALGVVNTGILTSSANRICTQTPTQTHTTGNASNG